MVSIVILLSYVAVKHIFTAVRRKKQTRPPTNLFNNIFSFLSSPALLLEYVKDLHLYNLPYLSLVRHKYNLLPSLKYQIHGYEILTISFSCHPTLDHLSFM
ncbi:hypothetical protein CW304_25805 [Bacillus sp. UFRGS-B20]|nr:hypothetical protein CW304_25805 [Bacillus sp. UFRGS-B20]